jgi:hypothetical protein
LEIPESKHTRSKNTVTTAYMATDSGFAEVECGQSVTPSGTVVVDATRRFSEKVVIK